jgi:hypothetical protein
MERIRLVKDYVDIHVILPIQVEGNYITLGWFLSQARLSASEHQARTIPFRDRMYFPN